MTVFATAGDVAALIVAIFWAFLVVALSWFVVRKLGDLITGVTGMVDGITSETVPLLNEVGTTVRSVNREIERVDAITGSVQRIAQNAETISATVKTAVSNPLVKALAFAAGAKRATRKIRER